MRALRIFAGGFQKIWPTRLSGMLPHVRRGFSGLLKTMHKGTRHIGKAPEALRATRDSVDRLKSLQKKLAKAVGEEDYETAAAVRDEIKTMSVPAAKTR